MSETQLRSVFFFLCGRIQLEHPETYWETLRRGYDAEDRFYHTFSHIQTLWLEFTNHQSELDWVDPFEWALFWHDAFYSTKVPPRRNEAISTEMALQPLEKKSPEFKVRVENLIMATCHDQEPTFNDAKFLCDFDLLVLGRDEDAYMDYANRIRHEYHWVPLDEYSKERIQVLKDFLDRDYIYATQPYREKYEGQARDNLRQEIVILGG